MALIGFVGLAVVLALICTMDGEEKRQLAAAAVQGAGMALIGFVGLAVCLAVIWYALGG